MERRWRQGSRWTTASRGIFSGGASALVVVECFAEPTTTTTVVTTTTDAQVLGQVVVAPPAQPAPVQPALTG